MFVVISLDNDEVVDMFYNFLFLKRIDEDWGWYTFIYINKDILILVGILIFKRNKDILSSFSKLSDEQVRVSAVFYKRSLVRSSLISSINNQNQSPNVKLEKH